jgi:integrase
MQLSLGLVGVPDRRARQPKRTGRAQARHHAQTAALLASFRRRLAATGASRKAQQAYLFQMEQLVAAAHRHRLQPEQGLADMFRDAALLGLALVDDRAAHGGTLSRWTLAQRRAAVRAFARLMAPDLRPALSIEPEEVVITALRRVAERVGGGYRLSGGAPRRRGGPAPTATEVQAIIATAASVGKFHGKRNRAFLTLLHETGTRANALRQIDGQDIIELPDGRLRLLLHAKGRRERREVEVSKYASQLLREYVGAFNGQAAYAGRPEHIGFGEAGPFWRSTWRQQWAYANVAGTFERACLASGSHAYSLHALRRGFASDAASRLPRHVVAAAGGWQGLARLDNHYVQPRMPTIAQKLGYHPKDETKLLTDDRARLPL